MTKPHLRRSADPGPHRPRAVKNVRFSLVGFARTVVIGSFLIGLTGCGTIGQYAQTGGDVIAAQPLAYNGAALTDKSNQTLYTSSGDQARAALAILRVDSITKCQGFLERLTLARGGANYASDTTTSLLSAAAAITTPLAIAHALAAGSTVVGASKSSYNTEFFDNTNTGALMQIIVQSYYLDLKKFDDALTTQGDGVRFSDNIDQLNAVHANCSMIYARATQSATVQAALAKNTDGSVGSATAAAAAASAASAASQAAASAKSAASAASAVTEQAAAIAAQPVPVTAKARTLAESQRKALAAAIKTSAGANAEAASAATAADAAATAARAAATTVPAKVNSLNTAILPGSAFQLR